MSFVILAEPRSGSTHLSRFLKDIGITWNDERNLEIFNPINKIENKPKVLKEYYSCGFKGTKILLMPDQIDQKIFDEIKNLGIKVILLTRNDKINQIISHIFAYSRRIWHNYNIKLEINQKIVVNLGAVRWIFMHYKKMLKLINNANDLPNDKIEVEYNDVISIDGKKKVCEFIGVNWDNDFMNIMTEQKMSKLSYEHLIENYNEVYDKVSEFVDRYY